MRVHKLQNVQTCLDYLTTKRKVRSICGYRGSTWGGGGGGGGGQGEPSVALRRGASAAGRGVKGPSAALGARGLLAACGGGGAREGLGGG